MFIDDDEYEGGVDRQDCCAHVPIITCNWPPWDTSEGQHSKKWDRTICVNAMKNICKHK